MIIFGDVLRENCRNFLSFLEEFDLKTGDDVLEILEKENVDSESMLAIKRDHGTFVILEGPGTEGFLLNVSYLSAVTSPPYFALGAILNRIGESCLFVAYHRLIRGYEHYEKPCPSLYDNIGQAKFFHSYCLGRHIEELEKLAYGDIPRA